MEYGDYNDHDDMVKLVDMVDRIILTLESQETANRAFVAGFEQDQEDLGNICASISRLTKVCEAQQDSLEALIRVNVTLTKEVDKLMAQNMMMGGSN